MKKRMLAWLLVLVMALGMVPVPAMAQEYAPTDGTAIDRVYQTEGDTEPPGPIDGALTTFSLTPTEPAQAAGVYQISSKEELAWLAQEVNEGRGGSYHAVLTNDIDLENEPWTPIGNYPNKFQGSFDGQGHTVSGLNVSSAEYAGLFGYVQGGSIENVVTRGEVAGSRYAGGVVGHAGANTSIRNCGNEAAVTVSASYYAYAGGVLGYSTGEGILSGCYSLGSVTASTNAGGIAGYTSGMSIENSYNLGTVTGKSNAGGIRGNMGSSSGPIRGCYNTGSILGDSGGQLCAIAP